VSAGGKGAGRTGHQPARVLGHEAHSGGQVPHPRGECLQVSAGG
jgi:hypothetical protein